MRLPRSWTVQSSQGGKHNIQRFARQRDDTHRCDRMNAISAFNRLLASSRRARALERQSSITVADITTGNGADSPALGASASGLPISPDSSVRLRGGVPDCHCRNAPLRTLLDVSNHHCRNAPARRWPDVSDRRREDSCRSCCCSLFRQ